MTKITADKMVEKWRKHYEDGVCNSDTKPITRSLILRIVEPLFDLIKIDLSKALQTDDAIAYNGMRDELIKAVNSNQGLSYCDVVAILARHIEKKEGDK